MSFASPTAVSGRPGQGAAVAAAVWSLLYAAAAAYWALDGAGFPFGEGDPEAADMGSVLVGAAAQDVAAPIAAICAAGGAIAIAMARPGPSALPRRVLLAIGWTMTALLILVIPDVRLMRDFAYLVAGIRGFVEKFDWPAANQVICLVGGLAWGAATHTYQSYTRPARACARRAPREDASRWARVGRRCALAAVLLPMPYELVRWAWALGLPLGVSRGAEVIEQWGPQERAGMFVMASLPLLGGLLTHGLVRPWGEIWPRWVPRRAGRPIPVALVVLPATLTAAMIVVSAVSLQRMELNVALGRVPPPAPDIAGWGAWAPGLLWLPWGVSLGAATYAYWRRRRSTEQ